MSTLEGHLEDVDLDEVVKVVALSKKSGVLSVESGLGTAEILFHFGRVVRVQLSTSQTTVGQLLTGAGVVGQHDLGHGEANTVDDVLRLAQARRPEEDGLISRAETVIRDQLEETLVDVLSFDAGSFAFKLAEPTAPPRRYPRDTSYIVSDGIDPEGCIREARRRRSLKSRDPLRKSMAVPRSDEGESVPELLVVDDDPHFLDAASRQATAAGLEVTSMQGARAGIEGLSRMNGESPPCMMVVDLVMPRSNGRGILGGLELLRKAHAEGLTDRIFLALEEEHEDARRLAKELGVRSVVKKPLKGESFSPFLNPILIQFGQAPIVEHPIDLVSELRTELGESATDWTAEPDLRLDDQHQALEVLKSLLAQINNPTYEDEIPLLLLRFAAKFFTRGALFGLHEESGRLVGLGGYGVGAADPGRTIHAIKVPAGADTVFTRAIRERCGIRQPFFESEWNLRLLDALGGPRPREVYTAPLLSPRGLEAMLYADNASSGRPFPDISLLEIFVQQAGVALERSSLIRQIEESAARPTLPPMAAEDLP